MAVTTEACFPLGTEKHVFVDWNIVEPGYGVAWAGSSPGAWEMPSGIELAVHKPRVDDGPFISADKPWEATVGSHGVVFDDEGVYRFYISHAYARRRGRRIASDDTCLRGVDRRRDMDEAVDRDGRT